MTDTMEVSNSNFELASLTSKVFKVYKIQLIKSLENVEKNYTL